MPKRIYTLANKLSRNKAMANAYRKIKVDLIQQLGGKCVKCGSTSELEFDHVDPATKLGSIAKIWSRKELLLVEIKKCQLLCKTCHKLKTKLDRPTLNHGTVGMYEKYNCRCEECKTFYSGWRKRFRSRQPKHSQVV